ncbi:hypothetical protein SeMB42_g07768 [Synchytrium endobioticum]|uniref:Uncharacterized protein n=1 Tax=Synchytrium endobioticum TaxID=286115 RepID=A0A507BW09_9FUNG|nr:hypothetical protein SeMB42_g07768 [Synchytrium endobioticum]
MNLPCPNTLNHSTERERGQGSGIELRPWGLRVAMQDTVDTVRSHAQNLGTAEAPTPTASSPPIHRDRPAMSRTPPLPTDPVWARAAAHPFVLSTANVDDICFASTQGGLRGKLALDRHGKHAFLDKRGNTSAIARDNDDPDPDPDPDPHALASLKARLLKERLLERDTDAERDKVRERLVKGRTSSADAWSKLVTKENKSRAKYYSTDKTLLVLLEEERSKYLHLESEYHKLLSEVQALQANHLAETKNHERRHNADERQLQKALLLKSEECTAAMREAAAWQQRYARESAAWTSASEQLDAQASKLATLLNESEARGTALEKQCTDTGRLRRELADKLHIKEAECKALQVELKSREAESKRLESEIKRKEADWKSEKEGRMKLEVHCLQLDHFVNQRDEEIRNLSASITKKNAEIEDLNALKPMLEQAKKDNDAALRRETTYTQELDHAAARERKLFAQVEDLSSRERRANAEVERLSIRERDLVAEIETLRANEHRLRNELQDAVARGSEQAGENQALGTQIRRQQGDLVRLGQDLNDVGTAASELRAQLAQRDRELAAVSAELANTRQERDEHAALKARVEGELGMRARELHDSHARIDALTARINTAEKERNDMRHASKEKLHAVQARIADLQAALSDTQAQVSAFRDLETQLRGALRERDARLAELQDALASTHASYGLLERDRDALRARKKDEVAAIQDKFSAAKAAMEHDVGALRAALATQTSRASQLHDEVARLRIDVSELSAAKFRAEAKCSELAAAEQSWARQVASLRDALRDRELDADRIAREYRRVRESVASPPRNNTAADSTDEPAKPLPRKSELRALQGSVAELSSKLRKQVDQLLDRSTSSSDAYAATPDRHTAPHATTASHSIPRPRRMSSSSHVSQQSPVASWSPTTGRDRSFHFGDVGVMVSSKEDEWNVAGTTINPVASSKRH